MKEVNLSVNVFPIEAPQGNTMAFASVAVDDLVAIRSIRVIDGENGLFVSMPQSQDKNGEFHDIAFPLNGELRKAIELAIIEKYTTQKDVEHAGKKPSLSVRVTEGKKKSAEQPARPANRVAKTHGATLD
ncbi:SpoVG family protein [Eubacteriales bacterium OttesenSCG-928-G02]|nr:SpoVG family protein [Eubacteriales bacterium OttesenSCG-928-G02]